MSKFKHYFFYFLKFILLATFAQHVCAEGAQKIVKWKDDKGATHYGDVLPSQEAGRGNSVLNKEGVVIKKNDSSPQNSNDDAEEASVEKMRQDSALLASYSSVEEIDLALERNVQTEQGILKVLYQRLIDARENLQVKQAMFDSQLKSKQKPSKYLLEDIKANQTKIAKTQVEITATENNIALIEARFSQYKARYAELRPRNESLTAINLNKKTLAELENWKRNANEKLSAYLKETVKYKRLGAPAPSDLAIGIQQANQEIARADQEIAAIKSNIKSSQERFSSK
jgi:D-ribose pyranose/furanose isomerase RbsD